MTHTISWHNRLTYMIGFILLTLACGVAMTPGIATA
jgi:hypothetical protein